MVVLCFQKSRKVTNLFSYMQIKKEKCAIFYALFTFFDNFYTLFLLSTSNPLTH